jgi:hypothetical protein
MPARLDGAMGMTVRGPVDGGESIPEEVEEILTRGLRDHVGRPVRIVELQLFALPELAEFTSGTVVADRNYHSPKTKVELATIGVELLAPYSSKKKRDPAPRRSTLLSRFRYRIDTVFSQSPNDTP